MLGIVLAVAALILAVVALAQGGIRNWVAWGVICLAALHLLSAL